MEDIIKGRHTCFFCNWTFEWESELRVVNFMVRKIPEVKAEAYAIGKENGKTQFEIVCRCPECSIKNKFTYE